MLDLYDLGSEIPERRRGERSGEKRRRVYDLYARERLLFCQTVISPSISPGLGRFFIFAHTMLRRKVFDRAALSVLCWRRTFFGGRGGDGPIRYRRSGWAGRSAGPGSGAGGRRDKGRAYLGGRGGVLIERCR